VASQTSFNLHALGQLWYGKVCLHRSQITLISDYRGVWVPSIKIHLLRLWIFGICRVHSQNLFVLLDWVSWKLYFVWWRSLFAARQLNRLEFCHIHLVLESYGIRTECCHTFVKLNFFLLQFERRCNLIPFYRLNLWIFFQKL
jgi:hypothetical protein